MKQLFHAILIPLILVIFIWLIQLASVVFSINLHEFGIYPHSIRGLIGIVTAPLIHADFAHCLSNTLPLLILGSSLFYFYQNISIRILTMIWLFDGIFIWLSARTAWHFGMSGVVYGLFSFLLVSGFIRKNRELIAISLLTVFLYGGMAWGFMAKFYAANISYEAHTGGLIAGLMLSVFYRKKGPQKQQYQWDESDETKAGEMQKKKIIVEQQISYTQGILEPFAEVIYINTHHINPVSVFNADALIVSEFTECNKKLLETSSINFIATTASGFDHIDVEYCKHNQIEWSYSSDCNSNAVMQYVASALSWLFLEKNIKLSEQSIGIIGAGNTGKKVAQLAEILGIKVFLYDPPRALKEGFEKFSTLESIQKEATIISFHLPLQTGRFNNTFHFADETFFNSLKCKPFIINTCRGAIIDPAALKSSLQNGRISGCILDVFENEPHVDKDLIEQCFLATPHIAGFSTDGQYKCSRNAIENVCRFFDFPFEQCQFPPILPPEQRFLFSDKYHENLFLFHCFLHCYNIKNDDMLFRNAPYNFEYLRNHYNERREFQSFTIINRGMSSVLSEKLRRLGFQIKDELLH